MVVFINYNIQYPYISLVNTLDNLLRLNLDCYFLVTPTGTHYNIAKKIISNSNDLFIEKPVTLSSNHILNLSKISKIQKTILMSGYIYNYNVYLKYINIFILKDQILALLEMIPLVFGIWLLMIFLHVYICLVQNHV